MFKQFNAKLYINIKNAIHFTVKFALFALNITLQYASLARCRNRYEISFAAF